MLNSKTFDELAAKDDLTWLKRNPEARRAEGTGVRDAA